MTIEEILTAKEGENFEFKMAENRFSYTELQKYACAISNEGGGKIVFGITDKRPRQIHGSKAFDQPERTRKGLIDSLRINVDFEVFNDGTNDLYIRDAEGNRLSREPWVVKYADSEDILRGNFTADKVFDLQESTYWRTAKAAALPHLIVIDLGSEQTVSALDYLPRAEQGAPGSIKDFQVFVY